MRYFLPSVQVVTADFLTKPQLLKDGGERKMIQYIVPNTATLSKLTPDLVQEGWAEAAEVIDDNLPDPEHPDGHGTPVACIAGGSSPKVGVAWKANLGLIKAVNFYTRQHNGVTEVAKPPGSSFRIAAILDAFTVIYDVLQEPSYNIDPARTVINLSIGGFSLQME